MIIGLTGGIGAGKSTVCKLFNDLGIPTISADEINKEILNSNAEITNAIELKFGTKDRARIRAIIFNSESDRIWLENLLHPLIKQRIMQYAIQQTSPYCVIEIPLLFEANLQDTVDRVLTIDCPEDMQLQRTMLRDNSSRAEIQAILESQITRKARLDQSDDIIENTKNIEILKERVHDQHNYYLSLIAAKNN